MCVFLLKVQESLLDGSVFIEPYLVKAIWTVGSTAKETLFLRPKGVWSQKHFANAANSLV